MLSSSNALAQVPTQPGAANLASQDSFNTWVAGTAVDHWTQADTGTASVTSPVCDQLDVAWTFANPAYAIPPGTLTSLVPAGASQVTATVPAATPGAGSPQTSTTTITKNAAYLPGNAGLRVYLPWKIVEQLAGGAWAQTFSWAGSGSVVIAP